MYIATIMSVWGTSMGQGFESLLPKQCYFLIRRHLVHKSVIFINRDIHNICLCFFFCSAFAFWLMYIATNERAKEALSVKGSNLYNPKTSAFWSNGVWYIDLISEIPKLTRLNVRQFTIMEKLEGLLWQNLLCKPILNILFFQA